MHLGVAEKQLRHLPLGPSPQPSPRSTGARELFRERCYVQLLKSGKEKDGRYWSAVVKLGPKTDKFKVTGYPVLFRAAISGGAIQETLSTVLVDMD
jgi:hypothetical protein